MQIQKSELRRGEIYIVCELSGIYFSLNGWNGEKSIDFDYKYIFSQINLYPVPV